MVCELYLDKAAIKKRFTGDRILLLVLVTRQPWLMKQPVMPVT